MSQGAREGGATNVQGWAGRYLLLGNSSCVALLSYIRVTMQYLHFHHPWWSYFAMSQEGGAVISMGGGHAEFVRNDFSALLTANCLLITFFTVLE